MSLGQTTLLGFIAGATILLGMPVGRMRRASAGARQLLNAVAIGILLFLVWDVLGHAWEPIDAGLSALHDGKSQLAAVLGYGALFAAGLAVGLLGLVAYEGWMTRSAAAGRGLAGWPAARRLALLIAVGIGLHNFAEGLAIGQSSARGELALATTLVVGFALHNATEGFGITAPLAADGRHRPSWGFLLLLALIGGGPTLVGTVIGWGFTSEPVSVVFLTLAAGSIIYVVVQLIGVALKSRRSGLLACGLLLGLLAGFATDAVVTAAGA